MEFDKKKLFISYNKEIFVYGFGFYGFFLTLDNYAITNYEKYYRRFYNRQFYLPY